MKFKDYIKENKLKIGQRFLLKKEDDPIVYPFQVGNITPHFGDLNGDGGCGFDRWLEYDFIQYKDAKFIDITIAELYTNCNLSSQQCLEVRKALVSFGLSAAHDSAIVRELLTEFMDNET